MNEREMAEKNMILKYKVGSHLYGTNTPTSDVDWCGVFIADLPYYYGFRTCDEVDLSVVSKGEDGKNTVDAVDFKLYELRKFCKLALDNNPNVIEQLFVNEFTGNEFGNDLLRNRHLFPWKGCHQKFKGYAKAQRHKMMLKPENFDALRKFMEWYDVYVRAEESKSLIAEWRDAKVLEDKNDFIKIGDLHFNVSTRMCKVAEAVEERLSKATHRTDMYTKFGYDTKFAMHLLRLLYECKELLLFGRLSFPLGKMRTEFLLNVRNGKYTPDEIQKLADELEEDCDVALRVSTLPSSPRFEEVEKLVMHLAMEFHKEA